MCILVKCGSQLSIPEGWGYSSDEAHNTDVLLTLLRPDGVGALQMSFAQYLSGQLPNIQLDDLRELLTDFAATRRLGLEQAQAVGVHGGVVWCRADYHDEADFIRVWYLSDSRSVILATYICNWMDRDVEIQDCDRIINSVEFMPTSSM